MINRTLDSFHHNPHPPLSVSFSSPLSSRELFIAFTYCSFIQKASSRLEENFPSTPRSKLKQIITIKNFSYSRPKRKKNLSKRQIIGVRTERQNEVRTTFAGNVTDETHTQREKDGDGYRRCKGARNGFSVPE